MTAKTLDRGFVWAGDKYRIPDGRAHIANALAPNRTLCVVLHEVSPWLQRTNEPICPNCLDLARRMQIIREA